MLYFDLWREHPHFIGNIADKISNLHNILLIFFYLNCVQCWRHLNFDNFCICLQILQCSEWSLCGDHVNCFCVGLQTHEISLPKTMNMISTDKHHELVLVFMMYYYWFDIEFNSLCTIFKSLLGYQQYHYALWCIYISGRVCGDRVLQSKQPQTTVIYT